MPTDPDIQAQIYQSFLVEAPELLAAIEQELFALMEHRTLERVHSLMRHAHTLKGAAASVERELIKTVAHHLEDAFKALYDPELELDAELGSLLWEGYECLRLPLTAEMMGAPLDETEVLDRTATVFARMQERIGDFWGKETPLLESKDLGYDLVRSVVEESMPAELDRLKQVIARGPNQDFNATFEAVLTQAEWFQGIAESYELSGMAQIAQLAIQALERQPDQALAIARNLLGDLRTAARAIIQGDPTAGHASDALRGLAGEILSGKTTLTPPVTPATAAEIEGSSQPDLGSLGPEVESPEQEGELFDSEAYQSESISDPGPGPLPMASEAAPVSPAALPQGAAGGNSLLDQLVSSYDPDQEPEPSPELEDLLQGYTPSESEISPQPQVPLASSPPFSGSETPLPLWQAYANDDLLQAIGSPSPALRGRWREQPIESPAPQPTPPPPPSATVPLSDPAQSIRVDLRVLDQLNQGVGELLITQDQQSLQTDHLHRQSRELQRWIDLCYQRILQAQDRANRRSRQSRLAAQQRSAQPEFDQLEMDTYTDLHVLLQSALEALIQVREGMESVTQYSQTAHLTLKRQRQVLSGAQADLLQARMVPLAVIFNRFPRVLQQLTTLYQKPVDLDLQGTQVLVDKAIAEKLYDPLLHLVRNAFSHGIESPEIRQQQGKPDRGQIQIRAYHQGNRTTLEIRDDGQGLNWERIRQKGIERGLLSPQQAPVATDADLIELLFQPGFSTATEISDLSGRGVGLDAVRAQIQSLQGSISIRSISGQGTTFVLQLPLTLTTARLLVCHDQNISYALLSDTIQQILLPREHQIQTHSDRSFLLWDLEGQRHLLPIHALSELIDYRYQPCLRRTAAATSPFPLALGRRLSTSPLLILQWGSEWICLSVDQVIGEQELVIKTLGRRPRLPDYIQGYSVLGNGRLAMVIDTQELIRHRWQSRSTPTSLLQVQPPRPTPANWDTPETEYSDPASPVTGAAAGSTPRSAVVVLVVDDSATQRHSVVLTLQKAGHTTLQAGDGQDAIEKLTAHAEIQVLICDIEMPRANGFEVLAYCRRDPRLQSLPILMLTSRSGAKHRQKALELGATGYLTKPYSDRELLGFLADQMATLSVSDSSSRSGH